MSADRTDTYLQPPQPARPGQVGKANVAAAVAEDGWTPLQLAARGGAVEKIQLLIAAGADVKRANVQVRVCRMCVRDAEKACLMCVCMCVNISHATG